MNKISNDDILNIANLHYLDYSNQDWKIKTKHIAIRNGVIISNRLIDEGDLIDLNEWIVFPSFFNLHAHLGECIFKEIDGHNWNLKKYLSYTDKHNCLLSKEVREIEWKKSAKYAIESQLNNGISGFCAARSAEISMLYKCTNMSGYPIMNNIKLKEFLNSGLKGFKEYYDLYNTTNCSVGIFFHSLYANDLSSLTLAYECLNYGAEFFVCHISEDIWSRRKEIEKYKKLPVFVLDSYGLLNENTILVHGGYLDDIELELISKRKARIVICPISNVFLNTHIINPIKLNKYGISWNIATDGLATGRTFSLLKQCLLLNKTYPEVTLSELLSHIVYNNTRVVINKFPRYGIDVGSYPFFVGIKNKNDEMDNIDNIINRIFNSNIHVFDFTKR